ncbi:CARDB domain-containing protein [Dyadobacter bucti]|uniref:CARDB domain-containing protein n=1 Tax=Dyadobacter bucti TaxID=2572203 RepID=UPI001108AA9D|nr:CARDB domain-containing protein [Dyadobacter bucti]
MPLVKFIVLLTGALLTFCSSYGRQDGNYLFDMGTTSSGIEQGYVQVTPSMVYTSQRAYGWITAPIDAFDTLYNRIPDPVLRDGVTGKGNIVFKTDIPPGEYFVLATVGYPGVEVCTMQIEVNASILTESITTPWFRLPYRSVRKKVTIGNEGAVVRIKGTGASQMAGIYRLEFRPVGDFSAGTLSKGPETKAGEIAAIIRSIEKQLVKSPGNTALVNRLDILQKHLTAETFYEQGGWSEAVKKTKMNQIQRMYAAIDLLDQIVADARDPIYHKSLYLLAKVHYWLSKEDSELLPDSKATEFFTELAKTFPGHELISMYKGDQIEDPYSSKTNMNGAPQWAVLQREAMDRMLKVIHWWVEHRQAPNGELGGKYADDVEMLRWWLPAILGADDAIARKGYTRMADGIWNSGELVRGYDKKIDDVEHAAELFRDSHAGMFLVRYGDPAYVERGMISMQNFEKIWSGITHSGHRHFKSYYFSATETLPEEPYGVDVPLNARALLTGLWTAWYNRNPVLIRLFSEWSKAWVEDSERAENGKPAGIVPPAVSFEKEKIGGYSDKWYDPELRYDYYRWDHLGHISELYSFLTGMHYLAGDPTLLKPVNKVAELITKCDATENTYQPGSLNWVEKTLTDGGEDKTAGANPFGNIFAMTARLTGEKRFDDLIRKYAAPYNQYQLTGNQKEMLGGFDQILNSLRYNLPLLTSEVKFTDRVYVRGSDLLTGMYTGHFGRGFEFPALVATWKNTGTEVNVFVRKGDTSSAVVSLYNAGAAKEIEMNTWMLAPGVYKMTIGTDQNDDTIPDKILREELVTITERVGLIPVSLPARQEVVIRIVQERLFARDDRPLADLAISAGDILVSAVAKAPGKPGRVQVTCQVHNIGNAVSEESMAYLIVNGIEKDSCTVTPVQAPNDLHPRMQPVKFDFKPKNGSNQITVSVKNNRRELNSRNNSATVSYKYFETKNLE